MARVGTVGASSDRPCCRNVGSLTSSFNAPLWQRLPLSIVEVLQIVGSFVFWTLFFTYCSIVEELALSVAPLAPTAPQSLRPQSLVLWTIHSRCSFNINFSFCVHMTLGHPDHIRRLDFRTSGGESLGVAENPLLPQSRYPTHRTHIGPWQWYRADTCFCRTPGMDINVARR